MSSSAPFADCNHRTTTNSSIVVDPSRAAPVLFTGSLSLSLKPSSDSLRPLSLFSYLCPDHSRASRPSPSSDLSRSFLLAPSSVQGQLGIVFNCCFQIAFSQNCVGLILLADKCRLLKSLDLQVTYS